MNAKTDRQVTVLYFASLREALNTGRESFRTEAENLGDLRRELAARGGEYERALAPDQAIRMALNQVMAAAEQALPDGAEVAFFPPVTGG